MPVQGEIPLEPDSTINRRARWLSLMPHRYQPAGPKARRTSSSKNVRAHPESATLQAMLAFEFRQYQGQPP